MVWKSSVEALQGEYFLATIYLIQKSELPKMSELNSISDFGLITSGRDGMDLMKETYPSTGMFVSPFEKLKVESQLLKVLEKKNIQAAKMIHAFQDTRFFSRYNATKDQPNVWEINIPDLFPITQESGSLSSAP